MDVMSLVKEDGTVENVEIVMTFKLDKYNSDYVFYKDKDKFYGAKYIETEGVAELVTDLTDEEKYDLSNMFIQFSEGGII